LTAQHRILLSELPNIRGQLLSQSARNPSPNIEKITHTVIGFPYPEFTIVRITPSFL